MGASVETHRDTDYLSSGTHKGSTSTTISDAGKDFKSCGVRSGLAVKNTTDSTTGTTSTITENTVATDITFHNGDTYAIYKTATYNSKIDSIYTDRRAGHKVTHPSQLSDKGYLPDDIDADEEEPRTFGPGQPERS